MTENQTKKTRKSANISLRKVKKRKLPQNDHEITKTLFKKTHAHKTKQETHKNEEKKCFLLRV